MRNTCVAAQFLDQGGDRLVAGAPGVGPADTRGVDDVYRVDLDEADAGAVTPAGYHLMPLPPPEGDGDGAVVNALSQALLEPHSLTLAAGSPR
jgi:hypothetical protein